MTTTASSLAIGLGALETILHELDEAGLVPTEFSWNTSDNEVTGGAVVQLQTTAETDRAGLLLFDATVQPMDSLYTRLLTYEGVRADGIRLCVFGPRDR